VRAERERRRRTRRRREKRRRRRREKRRRRRRTSGRGGVHCRCFTSAIARLISKASAGSQL
jgi:hypothetical protein